MKFTLQILVTFLFLTVQPSSFGASKSILTIHGKAGGLAQEVAMYYQKVLPKKASSKNLDSYANSLLEGILFYNTASEWGEFEISFVIESKKSEVVDQSKRYVRIVGDIAAEFMYVLSANPIDFPVTKDDYRTEIVGGNFTCVEQGTVFNSNGESNIYYCDLYLTADKFLK